MSGANGHAPSAAPLLAALGDQGPALETRHDEAWVALADAAGRHGVMPLVWHRLRERGLAELAPPEVRRRFEESLLLATLRATARRQQLDEIVGALRAHDVDVVLLKGADLALRAYPSPALRPMGDLDLLVREGEVMPAVRALSEVGYPGAEELDWATYHGHRHPPPLRRPARLPVELHDTVDPWAPPFQASMSEPWSRLEPAPVDCSSPGAPPLRGAFVMASDDLLLHVATHMGRNHLLGSSLLRVCDVAAWLGRFGWVADWDAIVRRARATGARRFVSTALLLTERLLGAGAPREVARALHDPSDDVVVADAEALLEATNTELSGALALTRDDESPWLRFARLVRALAIPPTMAGAASPDPEGEEAVRQRRVAYRARWHTVLRLLDPWAARAATQRLARVRRLRGWADGAG